jgi:hypothetical protein
MNKKTNLETALKKLGIVNQSQLNTAINKADALDISLMATQAIVTNDNTANKMAV